jgi:predicted amidohydrolase YtcJ
MMSKTGHAGWANTRALELAGVTRDEEPIDFFGKDPDGSRNGYVGTAAAAYYMMGVAGLKKEAVLKSAPKVLGLIASVGITHMFEAGQPPGHEKPLFDAIGEIEAEGKLTTRYTVACMLQREKQIPGAIECLKKFSKKYHSELFSVDTLKIHGDGSIEGHTSNFIEPYTDRPGEHGILSVPEEKSKAAAVEAASLGFNLHTHAIGDMANRSFLNVMQAVRDAGYDDVRLTMGHTVLVDDADLPRFKELNVIANYYAWEAAQPNPGYLEKLGPERYNRLMRMGTMVDMGIKVALSQDYPSAPINPFPHLHAAVTRSHVGQDEILGTEKDKLTVPEAIRAYTLDAAYAVQAERYSGSLEVGKRADLIVLDRNLLEIPEDDIAEAKVLKTVLGGKVVFDATGD